MALPIKFYGDRVDPTLIGPRQVASVPATKAASPPIQVNRWFRNGRHPNAAAVSMLNEAVNQAALYRTKEYFSFGSAPIPLSSVVGTRARWRFAFRTGPYQHAAYAVAVLHPPNAGHGNNTRALLEIRDGAGVLVASQTFTYGPSPTGTTSALGWGYLKVIPKFIDGLATNTEYFGTFSDVDYGRLQSATVFECPSMTENTSGYLGQNVTAQTPVVDVYREKQATILRELWRKGGAKVMTWTVDDGTTPRSVSTTTPTNIIDGTSTTYGAAIPGWTFDMSGKRRLSQTAVPVKIWAYLDCTSTNAATLHFRDSAGVSLASITFTGTANTPGWYSTTVSLPASSAKYYLTLEKVGAGGNTAKCYAVSIYEHET